MAGGQHRVGNPVGVAQHADRDAVAQAGDAVGQPVGFVVERFAGYHFGDEAEPVCFFGTHRVTGGFAWSQMPESLYIPGGVGLVELSMDGTAVPFPHERPSR